MSIIADRVRETSTTSGTGSIALAGPQVGFQSFSSAFTSGASIDYCITNGTDWEVGVGTLTSGAPWTLSRTTVLDSSSAGAKINFPAGIKDVFCTLAAASAVTTTTLNNNTLPVSATTGTFSGALDYADSLKVSSKLNYVVKEGAPSSGQNKLAASIYSRGVKLYPDETFSTGLNGLTVYDNLNSGNVTVTRVASTGLNAPNNSGFVVKVQHTGSATNPGLGGTCFITPTRANATLATIIKAKIPVGYYINFSSNSYGTGGVGYWATDTVGTGKWEDYVYVVRCGDSGTFSSTNFFYISGTPAPTVGAPLIWYISSATVRDVDHGLNFIKVGNTIIEEDSTATTLTGLVNVSSNQLTSVATNGTPPLVVNSTTPVTNLNIGGNAATATTAVTATNVSGGSVNATNGTFSGLLTLSNDIASINMDINGFSNSGIKKITCNDGGGNWNLRGGTYYAGGALHYESAGSGGTGQSFDFEGGLGRISWYVYPMAAASGDIAYANNTLTFDSTGLSMSSGSFRSTVATGTPPFLVNSSTPVPTLSIGGNAATATLATTTSYIKSPDGDRNAANKLPITSPQSVRFDFAQGSTAGNPGSIYAGVMTYAPWTGSTASTGSQSYQMSYGSNAQNTGTIPVLNIRNGIDSTWNSWYTILHAGNYNNYSPTLTGTGASGTWGINVTGGSAKLNTPRNINGVSFDGTTDVVISNYAYTSVLSLPVNTTSAWYKILTSPTGGPVNIKLMVKSYGNNSQSIDEFEIAIAGYNFYHHIVKKASTAYNSPTLLEVRTHQVTSTTVEVWVRANTINATQAGSLNFFSDYVLEPVIVSAAEPTWSAQGASLLIADRVNNSIEASKNIKALNFTGGGTGLTGTANGLNIGGNAATATVLQTARTINGVSFNGSSNITIVDSTKAPLTGAGASGNWGIDISGNAATSSSSSTSISSERLLEGSSSVQNSSLAAVDNVFHISTSVAASFLYDTTKDSDKGLWRKRCDGTSWFREPISGKWLGQYYDETAARVLGNNVYGANLLSPSDTAFTSGVGAWTGDGVSTVSASNGVLYINRNNSAGLNNAILNVTGLTIGKTYVFKGYVTDLNMAVSLLINSNTIGAIHTFPGEVVTYFVANATTASISICCRNSLTGVVYIKDLTFREVLLSEATTGDYYHNLTDGNFYALNSGTGQTAVYRGSRREFPAKALIVSEHLKTVIYDATDSSIPMWMVIPTLTVGNSVSTAGILTAVGDATHKVTSCTMLNGNLFVGSNVDTSLVYGLNSINFISEECVWYSTYNGGNGCNIYSNIAQRNSLKPTQFINGRYSLVDGRVNSVAAIALPTSPIDVKTGLQVLTIAVGTTSGVNVITDSGSIYKITDNSSYTASSYVGFTPENKLAYVLDGASAARFWRISDIPTADSIVPVNTLGSANEFYGLVGAGNLLLDNTVLGGNTYFKYSVDSFGKNNTGITKIKRSPSSPSKGLFAYITSKYSTGWMVGDTRVASLSSTTTGTLNDTTNTLTPAANSDFTGPGNWMPATGTSVSGGALNFTSATIAGQLSLAPAYTGLVPGSQYLLTYTITAYTSGGVQFFNQGNTYQTTVRSSVGTFTENFVVGNLGYLYLGTAGTTATLSLTNIILTPLVDDLSFNPYPLRVVGSLNKVRVATNSQLVGFTGFGTANYLEQPHTSSLSFGTADFSVMGWFHTSTSLIWNTLLDQGTDPGSNAFGGNGIFISNITGVATELSFGVHIGNTVSSLAVGAVPLNTYVFVSFYRRNGVMYASVNNGPVSSAVNTSNITTTNETLQIGRRHSTTNPNVLLGGGAALLRISKTAPTEDQIAYVYSTEKRMFEDNSNITLAGTYDGVSAIMSDEVTGLLHASTLHGTSVFKDLIRVSDKPASVGAPRTITAYKGTIVEDSTYGATVHLPSKISREDEEEAFRLKYISGGTSTPQDFVATANQTIFDLPAGFTPEYVYEDGFLKRKGVHYNVMDYGFTYSVVFTSGLAVGTLVTIMATRN